MLQRKWLRIHNRWGHYELSRRETPSSRSIVLFFTRTLDWQILHYGLECLRGVYDQTAFEIKVCTRCRADQDLRKLLIQVQYQKKPHNEKFLKRIIGRVTAEMIAVLKSAGSCPAFPLRALPADNHLRLKQARLALYLFSTCLPAWLLFSHQTRVAQQLRLWTGQASSRAISFRNRIRLKMQNFLSSKETYHSGEYKYKIRHGKYLNVTCSCLNLIFLQRCIRV